MAHHRVVSIVVTASLLASGPAFADAVTLQGNDPHLYVRLVTENTFFAFGRIAESGPKTRMVIFKGNIPISTDRFIEILEQKRAAPDFVERVKGKKATYTAWCWGLGVGPFLALAVGSAIAIPFTPPDSKTVAEPYSGSRSMATSLALGGLVGAVVMAPLTWLASCIDGVWFTAEEAVDAAQVYNRLVDQEVQP